MADRPRKPKHLPPGLTASVGVIEEILGQVVREAEPSSTSSRGSDRRWSPFGRQRTKPRGRKRWTVTEGRSLYFAGDAHAGPSVVGAVAVKNQGKAPADGPAPAVRLVGPRLAS